MTDYDPRIVDLYDGDNPDGPDHDYFRALADRIGARRILDLGCGTGILTVTLVRPGRDVTGVDPSASMLAFARRRPGGDRVRWVEGDSRAAGAALREPADLVILTGHVAQHIADPDWQRTLLDLRALLRDGGVLAFETRNPAARSWERWAGAPTTRDTVHGPLREWDEVTDLGDGRVLLRSHNRFERDDETVVQDQVLTFRDLDTLTAQLNSASFAIRATRGGWDGNPFSGAEPLIVVEAVASSAAAVLVELGGTDPEAESAPRRRTDK